MTVFKRLFCVLILITSVLCLSACTGVGSDKIKLSDRSLFVSGETTDEGLFVCTADKSEMKKLAASGMLELYIDEKTMAVSVYDEMTKAFYRALPEEYAGEKTAVLSVHMLIENEEHMLSSQADSVSFSCSEYEKTDSGAVVTYNFRQSLGGNKKLDLSVPLEYVLTDGMLSVTVDCDKITDNSRAKTKVLGLEILPFFAADTKGGKNDYILLPEGGGVVMTLENKADTFDEVSLKVYGEDPSVPKGSSGDVLVGAFGRKKGDTAFVCLVGEGDAVCEIKADKAEAKGGYNRVGAYFEITPHLKEENSIYVSDKSYDGAIELSYRFLGDEGADYIGMASAVRELLIRQGKLRERAADKNEGYPFILTLLMSRQIENEKGKAQTETLSTFTESYELLSALKAKGFENISVQLKGIYERGSAKLNYSLGAKEDFEVLSHFAQAENISLYGEAELFNVGGSFVKAIDGENTGLSSDRKISKELNSFIGEIRQQPFNGVSLKDVGETLFSDYSSANVTLRCNVRNSLQSHIASIYASKPLMVEKGNFYSIKYADSIINLPDASQLGKGEYFSDVPFAAAILHGICDYSLSAANLSGDSTSAMLKAAEYGALPHYEWLCTAEDEKYYMNSLGEAKAYYDKMKEDFSSVRDKRITAHKMIKENVYLTQFGEELKVYVNYGERPVTVSGITVDAGSYTAVG